jgi:hypothetical protein
MKTEDLENLVSRYNDPDLSGSDRARLKQMMEVNPDLRQLHKQYQQLDLALGQLPDGLEKVDFNQFSQRVSRVIAGMAAPVSAMPVTTILLRRYLVPLAAAAVIIAALPLFLLRDHQPTRPVGDIIAVVKLAQPQTFYDQGVINNIGVIMAPVTFEPGVQESAEESAVGIVGGSPSRQAPDSYERLNGGQRTGFFFILDGSE